MNISSSVEVMSDPLCAHVMDGTGNPLAVQFNVIFSTSIVTLMLTGFTVITGPTIENKMCV